MKNEFYNYKHFRTNPNHSKAKHRFFSIKYIRLNLYLDPYWWETDNEKYYEAISHRVHKKLGFL